MTLPPPPRVAGGFLIGSTRPLLADAPGFLLDEYQRLGPVFEVRAFLQRFTVMAGPEAAQFLLTTGERYFSRAAFYERPFRELGTREFILGAQGARHRQLRTVMRFAFSRQIAGPFVPAVLDVLRARAREWRTGQRLRVTDVMADLAFDAYCLVMAGAPMRGLFREALVYSETVMRVGARVRPAWAFAMPRYRRARRAVLRTLHGALRDHRERQDDPERRDDVLYALLATSRDVPGFEDAEIVATALYGFIGTLVYTNRLMAYLTYELLRDPALLAQATAEADGFLMQDAPTPQGLRDMPVLRSAYLETLRFHPIALGLPYIVEQDFDFAGHRIRKGSRVILSPLPAHFSTDAYTAPHAFDAARCRAPRDENDAPGVFVPFGFDGRVCGAVGLVEIITLATVATVLHVADLRLDPPDYAIRSELDPLPGPEREFTVRLAAWRTPRHVPAAPAPHADLPLARPPLLDTPEWSALLARVEAATFEPGALIVREGDTAEHFFILIEGTVDVIRQQPGGAQAVLATLGPGEYFGEIGLLRRIPRTASVRATSVARVLVVDRATFMDMVAESDLVSEQIAATVRRRLTATRLAQALPRVAPDELARVLPQCRLARYGPGDVIIHQGAPADAFYVIVSGRVEVLRRRDGKPDLLVGTMGPGEWFGEMGVLLEQPRAATVRVAGGSDAEVVVVDAAPFRTLIGHSTATRDDVWAIMTRRLAELERSGAR